MPRNPRRPKRTAHREFQFAVENKWNERSEAPPKELPIYRLITGTDVDALSRSVSEALKMGYNLYGSPILGLNGATMIAAQAVLWPVFDDGNPINCEDDEIPF